MIPARDVNLIFGIYFSNFYFNFFSRSKWSSMGLMLVFDRCGYLTVSSEFQTVSSGYFHRHGRGNQFEGAYSIPVWHSLCAYMYGVCIAHGDVRG